MKPLKLTLEGLHSFKERQEIDFSQLAETGLFGIFGATGSGKSSILDAITLSLYGAVKRAALNTQGILNSQKDKLEVSFTFAIGLGPDRKTFRIERSFRRNKDRRDSVTAKVCRLIAIEVGTETILSEGQSEVTRKIIEIIGLNMDDFTRSVVLPQGEFAQFLKLKDAERDQMLERVFSLAEYGSKLTEKVKAERERLSSELDQVSGMLQGLGDISPEKITKTRDELSAKKVEQQTLSQEYLRVEHEYENASAIWNLQQELEQATKDERTLLQSQPEIFLQRTLLKKAEAAEILRPYFEAYQKAEIAQVASRQAFVHSLAAFETAHQNYHKLEVEKSDFEKEYQEKQPELIIHKTRLETLLNDEAELRVKENQQLEMNRQAKELNESIQAIQKRLQNGDEYKTKKSQEKRRLESEIDALALDSNLREQILAGAVLEQELENTRVEVNQVKHEIQSETGALSNLENELRNLEMARNLVINNLMSLQTRYEEHQQSKPGDLASFSGKSESLTKLELTLNDLLRIETEIRQNQEEQTRMETSIREKEGRITDCSQACAAYQQNIVQLEQAKNQLQTRIKQLEEETYAAKLAADLQEGAPCPVCGSPHHPELARRHDPAEGAIKQKELTEMEQLLTTTREELKRVELDLTQNQASRAAEIIQLQNLQEKTAAKKAEQTTLLNQLPEGWPKEAPKDIQSRINIEKQDLATLRQAITHWENRNEQLKKELENLQEAAKQHDSSFNHIQGQLTIRAANLDKLNAGHQMKQQLLLEKQAQYVTLQQTISGIHSGSGLSFRERQKQLLEADKQTQELRKMLSALIQELEKSDLLYQQLKQELDQASTAAIKITTMESALIQEIKLRREKIQTITGERSVRAVLTEVEGALIQLQDRHESVKQQFEQSQRLLTNLDAELSANKRQTQLAEGEFHTVTQRFQEKLAAYEFINEHEFHDSLRTQEERESLQQKITDFEDRSKQLQLRINDLEVKLGENHLSAEVWEQLKRQRQEIAFSRESLAGQIGGIESTLLNLETQYQHYERMMDERQRLVSKKDMADEIQKLLQGNAFVAYIAEEHLRYILKDASKRLGVLTGGRYLLKMDERKDFIICDNGNGGLTRPVSSLSGGETFLVSLSLALALSNKIQLNGKNPLEFFFLDEGFGTLDPQLLDVVMDSLEKLQKESLTIGIISHVPELRNRISRRLMVTPANLNGEGSKVKIEKA
ncbi:MAG TPA: AAA family ATPase [Bacillota bacterium]|nr:AAA family ATPase [Bacillota bacterium]